MVWCGVRIGTTVPSDKEQKGGQVGIDDGSDVHAEHLLSGSVVCAQNFKRDGLTVLEGIPHVEFGHRQQFISNRQGFVGEFFLPHLQSAGSPFVWQEGNCAASIHELVHGRCLECDLNGLSRQFCVNTQSLFKNRHGRPWETQRNDGLGKRDVEFAVVDVIWVSVHGAPCPYALIGDWFFHDAGAIQVPKVVTCRIQHGLTFAFGFTCSHGTEKIGLRRQLDLCNGGGTHVDNQVLECPETPSVR